MTAIKAIDGLPVEDARKPIIITVTKGDCSGGDPKYPATCAAARALRREFHAKDVRVHLSRVYIKTTPDKWVRYLVPRSMRTEIISFDRGGIFAPGEFQLIPPWSGHRVGKYHVGKKTAGVGKSGKKRRAARITIDVRHGPA